MFQHKLCFNYCYIQTMVIYYINITIIVHNYVWCAILQYMVKPCKIVWNMYYIRTLLPCYCKKKKAIVLYTIAKFLTGYIQITCHDRSLLQLGPVWKTSQKISCAPDASITLSPWSKKKIKKKNLMETFPQSFNEFHFVRSTEKEEGFKACCLVMKTFRVFTVSLG